MIILTREQCGKRLAAYYSEKYGERDTDVWYDQPAANVWVFRRDDSVISLKCHILTGDVVEFVEKV